MGLDIEKLRLFQKDLKEKIRQDRHRELIEYSKSELFNETLNSENFSFKTKESSRVLTHWKNQGIIDDSSQTGKSRKYTKLNSIWINVVSEIRQFGLSLEKIKRIKEEIIDGKGDLKQFSIFEYWVVYSIVIEPIMLLINSEGRPYVMPVTTYIEQIQQNIVPTTIAIDLRNIYKSTYPNYSFDKIDIKIKDNLTENEIALLYYLRTGDFHEIKLRLNEGEILLLEGKRKHNLNSRVIDVLENAKYQDIEITSDNGNVIKFNSVTKIKMT